MAITYTPTFEPTPYVDGQTRVSAGGPQGFNIRFQQLQDEFRRISAVVAQIDAALAALGQATPARQLAIVLTPNLVATAGNGWGHANGLAQKPGGAASAQGMMPVVLPHGAVLQSLRATGRNQGAAAPAPGSGDLRITLRRMDIRPEVTTMVDIARVNGIGDGINNSFDNAVSADSQFAQVDTTQFRYFITAQLNNAGVNDTVLLFAFQITYTLQ